MHPCHITSVEVWVKRLHEQPLYALMSGFEPDQVPGVGTFYDFQDGLGNDILRHRHEQN